MIVTKASAFLHQLPCLVLLLHLFRLLGKYLGLMLRAQMELLKERLKDGKKDDILQEIKELAMGRVQAAKLASNFSIVNQ